MNNSYYIEMVSTFSLGVSELKKKSQTYHKLNLAQIIFTKVALSSFHEVINRLCLGTQGDGQGQEVNEGISRVKLF